MKKLSTIDKQYNIPCGSSLKRNNKLCKKNKMKPHEYGNPKPHKSYFSGKIIWHEEHCIFCNKKKFIFDNKMWS